MSSPEANEYLVSNDYILTTVHYRLEIDGLRAVAVLPFILTDDAAE